MRMKLLIGCLILSLIFGCETSIRIKKDDIKETLEKTVGQLSQQIIPPYEDIDHEVNREHSLATIILTLKDLEKSLGREDESLPYKLTELARLYRTQGRYKEAMLLIKDAVKRRKNKLGENHPDTMVSVNLLAITLLDQGRYGEAEPLLLDTLKRRKNVLGNDHQYTLQSLHNLAFLYSEQYRYAEAEQLYKFALVRRETVLGEADRATLMTMNNLGMLYRSQGRNQIAQEFLEESLKRHKHSLGEYHPETLRSINNLASLYQSQGRYKEAEPLFTNYLERHEEVLGKDHPDTLTYLNNLAKLYYLQGRYSEANQIYRRVLDSQDKVLGDDHPLTLNSRFNFVLNLIGEKSNARVILKQLKILESGLFSFIGTQIYSSPKQRVRRQLVLEHSTFQDLVLTLATKYPTIELQEFAADVLVRWKQIQSDEEAYLARLIRTTENQEIQTLGEEIVNVLGHLSNLANQSNVKRQTLQDTRETLENKEVQLANLSQQYKQVLLVRSSGAKQVRNELPPAAALLELRQYKEMNLETGISGQPRFAALLIPADSNGKQEVYLSDLGSVDKINRVWHTFNNADDLDSGNVDNGGHFAAAEFYQQLFGSMDELIKQYSMLYLAPDSFLHLVPFSQLIVPDGRYWIERQDLRRIQTGRHLIYEPSLNSSKKLLTIGGVDFNNFGKVPPITSGLDSENILMNRNMAEQITEFGFLSGSKLEAKEIAHHWENLRGKAELWTGQEASESRLKALDTPPRVLHIATHGFYLFDGEEQVERPMVLSGLALAGANQGLQGNTGPSGEDGILYALEVQSLNLEGTELVTLSACETGKGTIDYSEGIYGLQRAFRTAGARNLLITLWSLYDYQARSFMNHFYREWLSSEDKDPSYALRQTQLAYIQHEIAEFRDPIIWAPFILVETRQPSTNANLF